MASLELDDFADFMVDTEKVIARADELGDQEVAVLTASVRTLGAVMILEPERDRIAADALRRAREPGGAVGLTHVLVTHGITVEPMDLSRMEEDLAVLRREVARTQDTLQLTLMLSNASLALVEAGEPTRARQLAEEAVELATGFAPVLALGSSLHLVTCDLLEGRCERAFWAGVALVRAFAGYGLQRAVAAGVLVLAAALADAEHTHQAVRLWGVHDALAGDSVDPATELMLRQFLRPLTTRLCAYEIDRLRSAGAAIGSLEGVLDLAEAAFRS